MAKRPSQFAMLRNFVRTEYQKLKQLTFKQRLEYYRMYYLVPGLITIFVLTIAISGIVVGILNSQREDMLYVQLVGSTLNDYTEWVEDYQDDRGYTDHQFLKLSQGQYFPENLYYFQTTSVFAATDSLDVFVCEDSNLDIILQKDFTSELTGAFTSPLLNERLCYTEFTIQLTPDTKETVSGYYYVDITGTPFAQAMGIEGNAYLLKCTSTERHAEVEAFFEYVLTQE